MNSRAFGQQTPRMWLKSLLFVPRTPRDKQKFFFSVTSLPAVGRCVSVVNLIKHFNLSLSKSFLQDGGE